MKKRLRRMTSSPGAQIAARAVLRPIGQREHDGVLDQVLRQRTVACHHLRERKQMGQVIDQAALEWIGMGHV
ncbi:MAG: hypothetical protein WDN69_15810 [Aliidongia sp.]